MSKEAVRANLVSKALNAIKKHESKRYGGISQLNLHRIRALKGLCGSCVHCGIEVDPHVRVSCTEGKSPITIYENLDLGEEPKCDSFSPLK